MLGINYSVIYFIFVCKIFCSSLSFFYESSRLFNFRAFYLSVSYPVCIF